MVTIVTVVALAELPAGVKEKDRNMVETTGATSIDIRVSPDAVYAILTDLTRISELSPECYKAEWEGDSAGPAVGATFRGYNQYGEDRRVIPQRTGHTEDSGGVGCDTSPPTS